MLNRDIMLEELNTGEYDRVFYINDFKIVDSVEAVENSIIIGLMTRLGELNHNFTYNGFGCGAQSYLKQNNIPLTQLAITESIQTSLKKIKEIKNIEHIQIEPNPINPYSMDVFFTITLYNNAQISNRIELRSI